MADDISLSGVATSESGNRGVYRDSLTGSIVPDDRDRTAHPSHRRLVATGGRAVSCFPFALEESSAVSRLASTVPEPL
ncbi:unnamed protein product [Arctia plantaginis]|uniref:Uncharacterized protein n=1 Tax=Arctia plantaginis TaxID=874455 RepID=A0A8S1B143_ARCPL|nr:unnamed protein product [Arctia plantaginis]